MNLKPTPNPAVIQQGVHTETVEHCRAGNSDTMTAKVQERTKIMQEAVSQLHRAEQTGHIGRREWYIPENRVVQSRISFVQGEFQ